ncbi:MAG: type I restriction endonuclease subunit R [Clostridia bacterium]|nr:type I restriction endonuclease subunit R [Clostridia bacterium]
MNNILSEKEYQHYIMEYLREHNGYIVRKNKDFDRYFAIDREMLFKFLNDTQPDVLATLRKSYGADTETTVINYVNNKIMETSLIEVLKSDHLEISGTPIKLMYTKPATSYNQDLVAKYEKNILSVIEEVQASDEERVDLVIFLNGFAIMSFELKCNLAGQSYEDAIAQYRQDRNPKTRLFLFKSGCIVNFAMDLDEVHMTTKLTGVNTFFLPFNKGNGEGINTGKGNPLNIETGISVSYMWEDVLQKDMVIELLHKFVFVERKETRDPVTDKLKKSESVIFPRYHQLYCLRKTLDDVKVNHTDNNYLIQHSAGSGKTYTIACLAHRLASLHDDNNKVIYDNVVIITDRVVVDRQLQKAVQALEHKSGLIKVMDEKCSSDDLRKVLEGNTKIIATTIQKFLYIADIAKGLKNKNFAVIIDEAHSSTAGKDMAAVTKALGSETDEMIDMEDLIASEITRYGKQPNVSMFAFTATPKATTLQLFGKINTKGQREAFHLYSMKQAIEEGFILDVLQNFTPYDTYYRINKEIEEDPRYKNNLAKKKIARFAMMHETNISQRIEIIIEHFRNVVMPELGGQAKGMVITGSRPEAVKYYNAFLEYVKRKGYDDIAPLVAFSGKVTDKQLGNEGDKEYSEASLNGFSEDKTPAEFDGENYQVLLVANKYQTGFDQPKLCAMYVLKKLKGVNAVQTLSRLNRVCPPYDKKTFILDFVNSLEDMEKAFGKYYTTTLLCNSVTPEKVYELEVKVDSYYLFSDWDVDDANRIFYEEGVTNAKKEKKIIFLLSKTAKEFKKKSEKERREIYGILRSFVRFYEFLLQVSLFNDPELHKKYNFVCWLLPYLDIGGSGKGFDLRDKIQASNFYQKKGKEATGNIKTAPVLKLPVATTFCLTEDEERKLSDIIREVNSKTGKAFDNDVAVKAALQIRDLMKKNAELRASAANNPLSDFKFAYLDNIENALLDGRSQNQEFFDLLLNHPDIRDEVLGIFMEEIYNSLKEE